MENEFNDGIVRDNTCHSDVSGPLPMDYDEQTGNYLWMVKTSTIWAKSYVEAMEILSLIEQSPEHEPDNQ